ncbi:MAG: sulfur carrier protein ThiS [Lachnospiraceae bacterium]
MIKVNGKELQIREITLREYLKQEGYETSRIAVECNGSIVPKEEYAKKILRDGDALEVVSFVGGG